MAFIAAPLAPDHYAKGRFSVLWLWVLVVDEPPAPIGKRAREKKDRARAQGQRREYKRQSGSEWPQAENHMGRRIIINPSTNLLTTARVPLGF